MGGVLILAAIVIPTLLWADLTNIYVWLTLLVMSVIGADRFHRRLQARWWKKNSDGALRHGRRCSGRC